MPKRKFAYCVSTESTKAHDEMIKEGGPLPPRSLILVLFALIKDQSFYHLHGSNNMRNNKGPGQEFQ